MPKTYTSTKDIDEQIAAHSASIIALIIAFLQIFMTETLAKRLVGMVLIIAGVANLRVSDATGLCDVSIRALKRTMASGNVESLFIVGHGSGRPSKTKGLESAIAEELETNNYHSRQQIADMIQEKFNIRISVSAVGKLLKKTASNG